MKIASIKNYNGIFNTNFSFKSDEKQSIKSEQDIYIKRFVKDSFERRNPSIINNATNNIVKEFQDKIIGKIYSSPRLTTIDKQVKVLDEIADAYIRDCQFDKATSITLHTMNKLYQDKSITDNEKKQKILSDNHIYILKRFLDTSRLDNPLRKNVVDMICEMNYKEFLPIAEEILSYKPFVYELKNTEYTRPLRKFINSYYNLDNLSSFTDKNGYYKRGMCSVLEEWGLPRHIKYLTTILNSNYSDDIPKTDAIRAIGTIGGPEAENILKQYASIKSGNYKDVILRNEAIFYLDSNGKSDSSHKFLRSLFHNYESIKEDKHITKTYYALMVALMKYNDPDDVLMLEKNLYNPKLDIVSNTIFAIGNIKCRKSVDCLLSYLKTNPKNKYDFWDIDNINVLTPLAEALSKQKLTYSEALFAKNKLRDLVSQDQKIYASEINKYIDAIGEDNGELLTPKYETEFWKQSFQKKSIKADYYNVLKLLNKFASYNDLDYLINNELHYKDSYSYRYTNELIPRTIGMIGRSLDVDKYISNKNLSDNQLEEMVYGSSYFINYEPRLLKLANERIPILAARYTLSDNASAANYFVFGKENNPELFAKIFVRGNLKWQ